MSKVNQLNVALKNNYDIIISERSLKAEHEIFTRMLYDENKIEEIEYKLYLKLLDDFINDQNAQNSELDQLIEATKSGGLSNFTFTPQDSAQPTPTVDTPPATGGVQEGQTATNPQTGETLVFRNGQWSPQ